MQKNKEYIHLRDKESGRDFYVPRISPLYRRLSQGFLNLVRLRPFSFVKHIVLTQAVESYHPRILNSFFSAIRKKYGKVDYIWTIEEQERGVLHWHVIIVFTEVDFSATDVSCLQGYWKYGHLSVTPVRSLSLTYIMKYITKSIGSSVLFSFRRIGSSRVPAYFRQSWRDLLSAVRFFSDLRMGLDALDSFWWYNGSAYLVGDQDTGRGRHYVYRRKKLWEFVSIVSGEPF